MATSNLLIRVSADMSAASRSLGQLNTQVGGLGHALTDVAKIAGGVALGSLLANLGAGGRIKDAISATVELGNQTLKLQREIGGTAEQASTLIAVFERYGVGVDDASRSLGIFAKHLAGIEDVENGIVPGSKSFAASLAEIKISSTDVTGAVRPLNDVLLDVADRFAHTPDGIDKTALSMQLFGRAGKDMILFLNQGREGLLEAEAAASKYGLSLSTTNLESVRQFGLAHKNLDEAISGVYLTIGNALMPALTKLAGSMAGIAQGFNQSVLPSLKQVNPAALGATVGIIAVGAAVAVLTPVLAGAAASEVATAFGFVTMAASASEAALGVGLLGTAVAAALGPVGLAIIAASLFYAAYSTNFLGARDAVDVATAKIVQDVTILTTAVDQAGKAISRLHVGNIGLNVTLPTIPPGVVDTFVSLAVALNPITAGLVGVQSALNLVNLALDHSQPRIDGFTDGLGHASQYTDGFNTALLKLAPTITGFTAGLGGAEAVIDAFGQKILDQTALVEGAYARQKAAAQAAQVASDALNHPVTLGHASDMILAASDAMGGNTNAVLQNVDAWAANQKRVDAAAAAAQRAQKAFRPFSAEIDSLNSKIARIELGPLEKQLGRMLQRPINPNRPTSELPRLELEKKILELRGVAGISSNKFASAPTINIHAPLVHVAAVNSPADEDRLAAKVFDALLGSGKSANTAAKTLPGAA